VYMCIDSYVCMQTLYECERDLNFCALKRDLVKNESYFLFFFSAGV
jgi:hypothetical protein